MEIIKIAGPLILAFIMLSLGMGLTVGDFKKVITYPKDFFVGALSQIILFPILALILAFVFPIPVELKVGLILLAAAPGGVTTSIISKFADGNVALSISLTAVISLICFITVPLIFSFSYPIITGESLPFDYSIGNIIVQIFLITTIPVILGMILKVLLPNFTAKFVKFFVNLSFILFLFFVFSAIYSEFQNIAGYFKASGLITLVLNVVVLIAAFLLCSIFKIENSSKKTILIETGLQNGTLAVVVTGLIFNDPIYLVPIATYSLIMYAVIFIYVIGLKFIYVKDSE